MTMKPRLPILNRSHPLAQGLVGAWLAYEGAGATARDVSGRGNHGTLQAGMSWTVEQDGPVLDSERNTGDYITISDSAIIRSPKTIVVKMRQESYNESGRVIQHQTLESGDNILIYTRFNHWRAIWDSRTSDVAGGTATVEGSRNITGDTDWHTLMLVNARDTLLLYEDGEQIDSEPVTLGSVLEDITNTTGWYMSEPSNEFDGRFAYVMMFDRALPASQIRRLHIDPYAAFRPVRRWWAAVDVSGITHPVIGSGVVNSRAIIGGPS